MIYPAYIMEVHATSDHSNIAQPVANYAQREQMVLGQHIIAFTELWLWEVRSHLYLGMEVVCVSGIIITQELTNILLLL